MKRKSKRNSTAGSGVTAYTADENLKRLARTSVLEDFVRENDNCWDHEKWTELCEKITSKGFSPIDFDKVGAMLEDIKARYPNI